MLTSAKVPKGLEPLFEKSQKIINEYFKNKKEDPSKGFIDIDGEKYILIRAGSLSVDFFDVVSKLYGKEGVENANNITRNLLFDVAHSIGKQDALLFSKKIGLKTPEEILSAGPIHFSYSGWAFVNIFPDSSPSPDENCYLHYEHLYSFESDAWLASGKTSDFPVCIMNAGYSSGWCEECFGVSVVAQEVMCKAMGDPTCRFILAPPSRMESHLSNFKQKYPGISNKTSEYNLPGFFKRKELENALSVSESMYSAITQTANDAIIVLENPGIITLWNKKAEEMFGYTAKEATGMDAHMWFVPERYRQKACEGMKRFFATGEGAAVGKTLELYALRKDGSEFPVEISLSALKINGKWQATAIIRDISNRKQMEAVVEQSKKQLMTSQKLAGIGQLTDGVCHEILNPLNIISLQVQILLQRADNDPDLITSLGKIRQQINRISVITDLLLQFSSKIGGKSNLVKIDVELGSVLLLIEKDFQLHNVCIVRNFTPELPEILVNTEEVKLAFLNIVNNAKDAMPAGGTLTVSTQKVHEKNSDFIRIKFSDTGIGIKKKYLDNIFNPFFSTKPEGGGMGMGLTIAYNFIEKNGGTIEVKSEEGKGATFTIDLPLPLSEPSDSQ